MYTRKDNLMEHDEKRFLRRELINYYLHQIALGEGNNFHNRHFILRDLKFLVRNGEVYRYGVTLATYSQFVTYTK